MYTLIFIGVLAVVVVFVVRKLMANPGTDRTPPKTIAAEASGWRRFTPPEPELRPPGATAPPAAADGMRPLEQVAEDVRLLDISPDGAEALAHHDRDCVTLFDLRSGRAVKTWRQAAPTEWFTAGRIEAANCASRRLILCLSADDEEELVLIDLEVRTATRIHATFDGQDALQVLEISADGRFAAGLVTYGTSHAAFDLENPRQTTADEQNWGQFGDISLEPGDIWPPIAMSADGRWLAFRQEGRSALALELQPKPDDLDEREPWEWPDYREHMIVVGDDQPDLFAFSPSDDRLLAMDDAGSLAVVDLAAKDFRMLRPFDEPDDIVCIGLTWLAGRNQAMLKLLEPEPKLLLLDLAEGVIMREWPLEKEAIQRIELAPTGGFGIIVGDGGALNILPLLDP